MTNAIELQHVVKEYTGPDVERVPVLHIPELTLPAGGELAIAGPSGVGKTTLLNIIARLLLPTAARRCCSSATTANCSAALRAWSSYAPAPASPTKRRSQAAARLGLRVGSTFVSSHGALEGPTVAEHTSNPYRVVGLLAPTNTPADLGVFVPLSSYWKVHGESHGSVFEAPAAGDADHHDESGVTAVLVRARDISTAYQRNCQFCW